MWIRKVGNDDSLIRVFIFSIFFSKWPCYKIVKIMWYKLILKTNWCLKQWRTKKKKSGAMALSNLLPWRLHIHWLNTIPKSHPQPHKAVLHLPNYGFAWIQRRGKTKSWLAKFFHEDGEWPAPKSQTSPIKPIK